MSIVLTELQHRQIEEQSQSKLQAFQRKLYLKAKNNPQYKFYCLYDKVFRRDTLEEAYRRVKKNKGAAGIDGITFRELKDKQKQFIDTIEQELKEKTYKSSPLREVSIPKKNGKTRILRIPTIKDRTVQMALKLIIEPIFEADFLPNSYGYRPKKSAHDALKQINATLFPQTQKHPSQQQTIHSIDLQDCFDTIPHADLMNMIARRINDRQVLHLIKLFLNAGMMQHKEDDDSRGTPQGGVLSPLLANIYLDAIERYWGKSHKSSLYRYADDIIILLRKEEKLRYEDLLMYIEDQLKLIINHQKTTQATLKEGFDYLGFHIRQKNSRTGKKYLAMEPNREALNHARQKIREIIRHDTTVATEIIIERVNEVLRGWQQYFDNVCMGQTRRQLQYFVELRLMRFLSRRKKKSRICYKLFENRKLYDTYGLHELKNLGNYLSLGMKSNRKAV